jgi:hypothetical protein
VRSDRSDLRWTTGGCQEQKAQEVVTREAAKLTEVPSFLRKPFRLLTQKRGRSVKWLTTPFAIMVHATFSVLTILLACELLTDNHGPGGDYGLGLLFCVVAYPAMLVLLWLNWRVNGGALPRGADPRHRPRSHSQIGADTTGPADSQEASPVDRMGGPPEGVP